jgi:5,6,7,8-tetrahydromethanopterin hydro-lyase
VTFRIGEGFAGYGANVAHINVMLGPKDGPVGHAWATALATPRAGHTPFVVVLKPNVPVKPMTLFVNKATVDPDDEQHARLTWGAAQAGVAAAVVRALRENVIDETHVNTHVVVAAVWVSPAATDDKAVFTNNDQAMFDALLAARNDLPNMQTVLDAGEPENPYFPA